MPTRRFPDDPALMSRLKVAVRYHLRGILQLREFVDSDDVLQNVLLRLLAAAEKVGPASDAELLGLAARHIRWELIDLHRTYFGPQGPGGKVSRLSFADAQPPAVAAGDPQSAAALAEVTDKLPVELRQVTDLLFYNQLSHGEAAQVLGVTTKTVQRRWRDAKIQLARLLA